MILASDFDNTIYVEDKNQLQENIERKHICDNNR